MIFFFAMADKMKEKEKLHGSKHFLFEIGVHEFFEWKYKSSKLNKLIVKESSAFW